MNNSHWHWLFKARPHSQRSYLQLLRSRCLIWGKVCAIFLMPNGEVIQQPLQTRLCSLVRAVATQRSLPLMELSVILRWVNLVMAVMKSSPANRLTYSAL